MIDIENKVIDEVKNAIESDLRTKSMSIFITSGPVEVVAKLPAVCVYEADNTTYTASLDDQLNEHHANVTIDCDIFSGNINGRKAEAKTIVAVVDEAMQRMKFSRLMKSPLPNLDRSIYRFKLRYRAVIEEPHITEIKRTYQVYRK